MRLILACVVVLLIFCYVRSSFDKLQSDQEENLRYHHEKLERKFQKKLDVMCCFYRQHYHDCFSAVNHSGCVLGTANAGGVPDTVICSRNNGCDAPMSMSGFFLTGFKWNCDECENFFSMAPYLSYLEASRYPPSELSQVQSQRIKAQLNANNVSDDQYSDYV